MPRSLPCLLLTFLLTNAAFGQKASIAELKLRGVGRDSLWNYEFAFPFVICSNKQVQDSINFVLINSITQADFIKKIDSNSIRQVLQADNNDGMVDLGYNISLKAETLLGIDLFDEWYGAYSYNNYFHFLFDLRNGRRLHLKDLIKGDKREAFATIICTAYKDSLNAHMLNLLNDAKELEIDTSEMDYIMEYIVACRDNHDIKTALNVDDFYFEENKLVLEGGCWLPHAMMVFQPYFKVLYPIQSLKEIFRPEIFQQLISEGSKKQVSHY